MIFKSKFPDIEIPQVGIYQYVTSNPKKIPDDKVTYVDGITGRSYTFGEFIHETKKFAAGLQDKLGFKCGDVLTIFSPNQVDYPIVALGTIAAGGKVATANLYFEAADLSLQLIDSGASVLIVHPDNLEVAIEASIKAKIPASMILLFGDKEINGYKPYCSVLINDREIEPIYYTPEEAKSTTAYLIYTSGTTGKPKGIEITHTNLVAWLAQLTITECKLGSNSITTSVAQFCHCYALIYIVHATLILGTTTIVLSNHSVETICESIQKFKVNYVYTSPATIIQLVNDPLAQQYDLSSVDMILSAGFMLDNKWERKFYEMFKIPIYQCYGLSEACAVLLPDTTKNVVQGSAGILIPNMKAKILSDDGCELGYNQPGGLWIQGPNIFKGYINNKEATIASFDKDGFFYTEDVASVDEQGNYFIVDRRNEIIRCHEAYVSPSELESILLTHEAVSDAAVVGYEKEAVEFPTAYVTIKNGYKQSQTLAEEIQSFVDEKVESYKKLSGGVFFIDRIPKNSMGKTQRLLLRKKLNNEKMN
ncbi:hypothetical protein C2G38_2096732 [Gigaspora rosea]|uniref:AMP-dependent synthetase/ligase domain-containing protein n=1 Tax=Gigaspora rosea TaxID=44941 RepID=A0A397UY63_9GLOM|nr:hypothetical protein C2G38_2096732 [Gigaspora rosea]